MMDFVRNLFYKTDETERLVAALAEKTGVAVSFTLVATIIRAHPQPALFVKRLNSVLSSELIEAFRQAPEVDMAGPLGLPHFNFEDLNALSAVLALFYPQRESVPSCLFDDGLIGDTCERLAEQGYAVLPGAISDEKVQALIAMLGNPQHRFLELETKTPHLGYDRDDALASKSNTVLIENHNRLNAESAVRDIAYDPGMIAIAQNYLGAAPIHVHTNAWWSVNHRQDYQALAASAQQFHQDRGFIKFLKVFVYLTDVGEDNGPHEYVAGTAKDFRKAVKRRHKSGKRYTREHMVKTYGEDRVISMVAPKGTMIFEDTYGFHRGVPVQSGHRLVMELIYANSLYCSQVVRFTNAPDALTGAAGAIDAALAGRLLANYD